MATFSDHTGKTFGRWTVLHKHPTNRPPRWVCRCECGTVRDVKGDSLVSGRSTSCGCYMRESKRTHGRSRKSDPTYESWRSMKARCDCPGFHAYADYGGRGITYDPRWKDFAVFLDDMGERPSRLYTLDRYPNNDGNYEPDNCRWATPEQQGNNRRSNVALTYGGHTKTLAEWANEAGIHYHLLHHRIERGEALPFALRPRSAYASTFKDMTGHRCGKLVVTGAAEGRGPDRTILWACRCDCGQTIVVPSRYLRRKKLISCGCTKSRKHKSHTA